MARARNNVTQCRKVFICFENTIFIRARNAWLNCRIAAYWPIGHVFLANVIVWKWMKGKSANVLHIRSLLIMNVLFQRELKDHMFYSTSALLWVCWFFRYHSCLWIQSAIPSMALPRWGSRPNSSGLRPSFLAMLVLDISDIVLITSSVQCWLRLCVQSCWVLLCWELQVTFVFPKHA